MSDIDIDKVSLLKRVSHIWKNFLTGGLKDDLYDPFIRRMRFLNLFVLITCVACTSYGIYNVISVNKFNGYVEIAFGIFGFMFLVYVRKSRNLDLTQSVVLAEMVALMTFLLYTGGINKSGIYWWFCIPAGCFYFSGRHKGWYWLLATFAILIVTMIITITLGPPTPYSFTDLRQFTSAYLVVCLLVWSYESLKDDFQTLSEEKTDEIIQVNKKLTTEVAERIKTQQALEISKAEAERANQAKSEFLSRMSHELRTPMNSILGFSQLLESDTKEPLTNLQRENVSQILAAGNHLLALINEILDLSRIEAGRVSLSLVDLPVQPVIQEAVSIVNPLADKRGIRITDTTAEARPIYMKTDAYRLRQILLNLLSNAVKYNREGGSIVIEAFEEGDGGTTIKVTDSGMGIPEEKQASIFEPFQRLVTDSSGIEGTGIGLTVVRKLVELMGGKIILTSTLGLGSSFSVTLPSGAGEESGGEVLEAVDRFATKATPVGGTILYIEDELSNLALVKHILTRRPSIKLLHSAQGLPGIEIAKSQRPSLILLDVHLPDINGPEVFNRLQSDPVTRGIPVIVVSASAMPQDIDRLLKAGVARYLTKPLDLKLFLDTVDGFLSGTDRAKAPKEGGTQ